MSPFFFSFFFPDNFFLIPLSGVTAILITLGFQQFLKVIVRDPGQETSKEQLGRCEGKANKAAQLLFGDSSFKYCFLGKRGVRKALTVIATNKPFKTYPK